MIADADNNPLHEWDRVYTHDYLDGNITRFYGNLRVNENNPEVSAWYIEYDDGESCAVLDFGLVYKA